MIDHAKRNLPDVEFPPYTYVPGQAAHPKSHAEGHGCPGPEVTKCCSRLVEHWPDCETYLWGMDLFNFGYYWEAHEAWEEVWIAAGRSGDVANLLKSLIKMAAAGVKSREYKPIGIRRHAARAVELLEQLRSAGHVVLCGCDLAELSDDASDLMGQAEHVIALKANTVGDEDGRLPVRIRLRA